MDILLGGTGNDSLDGGADADTLIGGAGWDHFYGGAGGDIFVFDDGDSPFLGQLQLPNGQVITSPGFRDTIHDLSPGDIIDLRLIDADTTTSGDQTFDMVDAFTGKPGELMLQWAADGYSFYTVLGDVDGNSQPDFAINVTGSYFAFWA